jgi:hypothetical protein
VALALVGSAGASVHRQVAANACRPGATTIKGFQARVFCGPAKARVTIDGRSFTVTGGACERHSTYFLVNIGTVVTGTGEKRPKLPYFGLLMGRSPAYAEPAVRKPGTYRKGTITISSGSRQVDLHNEADLRITLGAGLRSGTFAATTPESVIYGTPAARVKGSFSC